MLGKRCTGLNGELITREMCGARRNRFVELREQTIDCFPRQRKHQIQIEVVEDLLGSSNGVSSIFYRMDAAKALQPLVAEALDAKRYSVDARRAECSEFLFVDRSAVNQSLNGPTGHEARRTAANENRCDFPIACA